MNNQSVMNKRLIKYHKKWMLHNLWLESWLWLVKTLYVVEWTDQSCLFGIVPGSFPGTKWRWSCAAASSSASLTTPAAAAATPTQPAPPAAPSGAWAPRPLRPPPRRAASWRCGCWRRRPTNPCGLTCTLTSCTCTLQVGNNSYKVSQV